MMILTRRTDQTNLWRILVLTGELERVIKSSQAGCGDLTEGAQLVSGAPLVTEEERRPQTSPHLTTTTQTLLDS